MAKKKKRNLRQVDTAEKAPTTEAKKGRASRREMISRGNASLANMAQELKALGLSQVKIEQFGGYNSLDKQVKVWEATELETDQKKAATHFQDIARRCKDIMEQNPSYDPTVLRDVAIQALDKWVAGAQGKKKVG